MAEAFLNHLATKNGQELKGESVGTMGGKALNPMAVLAMKEIGIDMTSQTPKLLTQEMADRAERIITMGCGVDAQACPAKFLVSEDWGLDDPAGGPLESVRIIRDQIADRVTNLMRQMESD